MGTTSQWAAAERQRENERCDRLFSDPLACALAGDDGRRMREVMAMEAGGESSYAAIRTRFFDDFALATAQTIHQLVLVAAGMDARAFRLPWPSGTVLFEIERAPVHAEKARLLAPLRAQALCDRRVVAADLLCDPWEDRLLTAGYCRERPTLFLVEGLAHYLPVDHAKDLFARIRKASAPGSRLGADFIGESFLRSPITQRYLARLRQLGVPWQFGTDQPDEFVRGYGWMAETTMPGDPDADWGRWPFPPARGMPSLPKVYLVRARLPEA